MFTTQQTAEIRNIVRSAFIDDPSDFLGDWISGKTLEELGLLDAVFPIGWILAQFPDAADDDADVAFPAAKAPTALYGGTWALQWNDEGIVFQTEGYDGAGRSDGLMEDQLQGHRHTFYKYGDSGTGGPDWAGVNVKSTHTVSDPVTDGTNGTPRTGTRTCHRNRLVRIWKRTA